MNNYQDDFYEIEEFALDRNPWKERYDADVKQRVKQQEFCNLCEQAPYCDGCSRFHAENTPNAQ